MKKLIYRLFLGGIFLILFAGLIRAALLPKEVNAYENRYAQRISPFSVEDYLGGSFQDGMESGLADQIIGAQYLKRFYNMLCSSYTHSLLDAFDGQLKDSYITLGDKTLFNSYIVYPPARLSAEAAALDAKASNYAAAISALSDTDVYLYYMERDRDLNLVTGEKSGLYEYLCAALPLPQGHVGRLRVDSFDDYSRRFYATDHHWNNRGSYQGYCEILAMLLPGETPLAPMEELRLGIYSGTKAVGKNGESFSEEFRAYRFDFPRMSVRINGEAAADYGAQSELSSWGERAVSYVGLYGADARELVFDTGSGKNSSLLVIGESNDNAIIKLLASHFDRCFCVDLRHYPEGGFILDEYVRANDIDKVLFVGNSDFYTGESFLLGY